MKITVKGNTFFVTSAFTVDELNLVAKNRPEALAKKDKDGNELFRIGVGSNSLNNIGISYGGTESDGSKLAMFTGTVSSEGDPKEYLADKYSGAFTAIEGNREWSRVRNC
jgi:hypothetical protein